MGLGAEVVILVYATPVMDQHNTTGSLALILIREGLCMLLRFCICEKRADYM